MPPDHSSRFSPQGGEQFAAHGTSMARKASSEDLTRKVEQTMWLGIISSATMLLFAVPAFPEDSAARV
jgi:hypothetical protein